MLYHIIYAIVTSVLIKYTWLFQLKNADLLPEITLNYLFNVQKN